MGKHPPADRRRFKEEGPDSLFLKGAGIVIIGMVLVGLFVWFVQ